MPKRLHSNACWEGEGEKGDGEDHGAHKDTKPWEFQGVVRDGRKRVWLQAWRVTKNPMQCNSFHGHC